MRAGTDMVVLDSRPFDEYQRVSIPTAVNVPGAELVLRIHDLAPSPQTLVVVNCAGRTRSIIGAQSLINAGVPNKVVALRNGTMGWRLAGLACDSGKSRRAPGVSSRRPRLGQVRCRSAWRSRFGIARIDRGDAGRVGAADARHARSICSTCAIPAEYAAGHVAGRALRARRAAGAGDRPVCRHARRAHRAGRRCRGARGDDGVLAAADGLDARWPCWPRPAARPGWPAPPILGPAPPPRAAHRLRQPARLIARDDATIVDLSLSRDYLKAHIPGAWFAIRSRLAHALATIPVRGTLVLTSEDGVLAGLAAAEAAALTDRPVRYLDGGNAAWQAAGHSLTAATPGWRTRPSTSGSSLMSGGMTRQGDERLSVVGGRPARTGRAGRYPRFRPLLSVIRR